MRSRFRDRVDAGRELAALVGSRLAGTDVLVLALPRGGVPVGYEIARALGAPLDVVLVRKLGVPGDEELAMGAIAMGGARAVNHEVVVGLRLTQDDVERAAAREEVELRRREQLYRDGRPFPRVRGRTVVLVDDGLATGATMHVAIAALRPREPERIVVAVPVAPPDTVDRLLLEVDDVIAARTPEPFEAIGLHYHDFRETTDARVRAILARAGAGAAEAAAEAP
jgi:putative phosphoribosyl transferase